MDMTKRAALLATLVLLAPPLLATTVYSWTDRSGTTHFTTEPPPPGVEAETTVFESDESAAPSQRVQEIRCRDFRGAVAQLEALDDVSEDNPQWLAARERAADKVATWCED